MSTKIYHAWKVELAKLREFQLAIANAAFHVTAHAFNNAVEELTRYGIVNELDCGNRDWSDEKRAIAGTLILGVVASQSPMKSGFNFDVSYNCWVNETHAYVMPFSANNDAISETLKLPAGAISYGYWNNTDQPKGITDAEWDQRGVEWDQFINNHNVGRMCCDVICLDARGGYITGATELLQRAGVSEDVARSIRLSYAFCKLPASIAHQWLMLPRGFESKFLKG